MSLNLVDRPAQKLTDANLPKENITANSNIVESFLPSKNNENIVLIGNEKGIIHIDPSKSGDIQIGRFVPDVPQTGLRFVDKGTGFDDSVISREHATLRQMKFTHKDSPNIAEGEIVISYGLKDNGSSNGTYILRKNQRISKGDVKADKKDLFYLEELKRIGLTYLSEGDSFVIGNRVITIIQDKDGNYSLSYRYDADFVQSLQKK